VLGKNIMLDNTVFNDDYATYYDDLYATKKYGAEVQYLIDCFNTTSLEGFRILDLGCGTGKHALLLAQAGAELSILDRSEKMLERAVHRFEAANISVNAYQADLQSFEIDQQFDAVISMFAVIGYVTRTPDLQRLFTNIRKCLRPGGVFVFDCWHGNAVLSEKPQSRIKTFNIDDHQYYRLSETSLDILTNTASVKFTILDASSGLKTVETHEMRYFFIPELRYMLHQAGFVSIHFEPFLKPGSYITEQEWNLAVVARVCDAAN